MKKILSLVLALMLTVLLLPVNAEAAEAKSIKLNKSKMTIYVGAKTTLKNTGTANKVKWSSTKPSVASVTQKGVVTAKKAGKATIVAKYGQTKVKCNITVKKNLTPKQITKKMNSQVKNLKNMTMKGYIKSISSKNLFLEMGVNVKTNVVYANFALFGMPKMYVDGKTTYWQDIETGSWFYFNSDNNDDDIFDEDDSIPAITKNAKLKLLSKTTFNKIKCAALRVKQDGETIIYYFDLADYSLVGMAQGSGSEKSIITIDLKTTVKVPSDVKDNATYKELSFEE